MTSRRSVPSLRLPALMAFGSLLIAGPVVADDAWYVVAKLGETSLEAAISVPPDVWRVNDAEDDSAAIELGYQLHPYFGLQLGYHDLGDYLAFAPPCPPTDPCPLALTAPLNVSFSGFSVTAVPRWPIHDRFALYGKVGLFYWEGDATPVFVGQPVDQPSDTELIAGIGAQVLVWRGLGLIVEYESTDLVDMASAGVGWRF